jgi:hypothetical protein
VTHPHHRPTQPTADLASPALVSRGLPVAWEILTGAGVRIGHVACPDETTALILATFRHGTDVRVRRPGVSS